MLDLHPDPVYPQHNPCYYYMRYMVALADDYLRETDSSYKYQAALNVLVLLIFFEL
jgi:hypothetical protein